MDLLWLIPALPLTGFLILLVTEDQLGRIDVGWGLEDYLTLPVSPQRLAERLNFVTWKLTRAQPQNGFTMVWLAIDCQRYEVRSHC